MRFSLDEGSEVLKNFGGLIGSVITILQLKLNILPINPVISHDLWGITSILSFLLGFGAHRSAQHLRKRTLGWLFAVAAIAFLLGLLALINTQGLTPEAKSWTARCLYILFFASIGGSVGGFLV